MRTPAEARAILEEAAKKRIKVAPPTGALAGSLPDEKGRQKVLDIVAVEALKERLLLEKVEREPSFTDSIEEEMLTWQPKLLRLRQTLGDGFPAEQWVVVFKTTRCGLRDGAAHEVLERDLEGQLCMDRLLEYPGGFDGSKPISVSVHPFEEIQRRPEAQGQWWQRLLLEAKKEVTEEFIEAYKKDGRLTL